MSFGRNEEVVLVWILKLLLDVLWLDALLGQVRPNTNLIDIELIAQPLQEQHPKDVFLVFCSIHVATKNVARLKQSPLQLRQRQLLSLCFRLRLCFGVRFDC